MEWEKPGSPAIGPAHHVVNHFPNGVWLVELAGINNALSVPTAIATALGILPDAGAPPENTLEDDLRDKSLLLILDNCEHLIEFLRSIGKGIHQCCTRACRACHQPCPAAFGGRVVRLHPYQPHNLNRLKQSLHLVHYSTMPFSFLPAAHLMR